MVIAFTLAGHRRGAVGRVRQEIGAGIAAHAVAVAGQGVEVVRGCGIGGVVGCGLIGRIDGDGQRY